MKCCWQAVWPALACLVLLQLQPAQGRSELAILEDIETSINNIYGYLVSIETQALSTTAAPTTETTIETTTPPAGSTTATTEAAATTTEAAATTTEAATTTTEAATTTTEAATTTTEAATTTTEAATTTTEAATTTTEAATTETETSITETDSSNNPLPIEGSLVKKALLVGTRMDRDLVFGQMKNLEDAVQVVTEVTNEIAGGTITEDQLDRVREQETIVKGIADEPGAELLREIRDDPTSIESLESEVQSSRSVVKSVKESKKSDQTTAIVGGVLGGVLLIVAVAFGVYAYHAETTKKKLTQAQKASSPDDVAIPMTERDNEAFDNTTDDPEVHNTPKNIPPPSAPVEGNSPTNIPPQSTPVVRAGDPFPMASSRPVALPPVKKETDARLSRYDMSGQEPKPRPRDPYADPRPKSSAPADAQKRQSSEYRDYPRGSRPREYSSQYPSSSDPRGASRSRPQHRPSSSQTRPSSSQTRPSSSQPRPSSSQRPAYDRETSRYYQDDGYRPSRSSYYSEYRSDRKMERRDFRRPYGPDDVY